jgi:hypothetical protein
MPVSIVYGIIESIVTIKGYKCESRNPFFMVLNRDVVDLAIFIEQVVQLALADILGKIAYTHAGLVASTATVTVVSTIVATAATAITTKVSAATIISITRSTSIFVSIS